LIDSAPWDESSSVDKQPITPESVAAVILNWNGGLLLRRCLQALRLARPRPGRIYVADNGSEDGTPQLVRNEGDMTLVENHGNLGFAGGNNRGIERALADGATAVLILNFDVVVNHDFLPPLLAALSEPEVGMAGPKMLDARDPGMIWCAGADITFGRNISRLRGNGLRDRGQYDTAENVDYIPAAALLVRREVFERTGLLDERYFCYMEDVDFCLRAARDGFRIRYTPQSVVYHRSSSATGGGYTPLRKYLNAVNSIAFMRRYGTPGRWLRFLASDVATLPLLVLSAAARGRTGIAWAKVCGIIDGFKGVQISAELVARSPWRLGG
jgi:GT2 family glycosyltransferase